MGLKPSEPKRRRELAVPNISEAVEDQQSPNSIWNKQAWNVLQAPQTLLELLLDLRKGLQGVISVVDKAICMVADCWHRSKTVSGWRSKAVTYVQPHFIAQLSILYRCGHGWKWVKHITIIAYCHYHLFSDRILSFCQTLLTHVHWLASLRRLSWVFIRRFIMMDVMMMTIDTR